MQRSPDTRYVVDPDDPRAPRQDVWDAMSPEERRRVVASLPADMPLELHLPRATPTGRRRTAPKADQPLVPQRGRWTSTVLGLDLALEGDSVRFYSGTAPLPVAEELIGRAQGMLHEAIAKRQEAEARADEEARLREDETRLREDETRRRIEAERRAVELEAELGRLRGEREKP